MEGDPSNGVAVETVRWFRRDDQRVQIGIFLTVLLKNRAFIPTATKITVVFTLAIALGETVSLDDLCTPDTKYVPTS